MEGWVVGFVGWVPPPPLGGEGIIQMEGSSVFRHKMPHTSNWVDNFGSKPNRDLAERGQADLLARRALQMIKLAFKEWDLLSEACT